MVFQPPHCPFQVCTSFDSERPFSFQRRGYYRRKCDGLVVPRFSCNACGRRFSRQTFRFNYRWWRPNLHHELFGLFVAKVTLRQAARYTGASRETVCRRMRIMGEHARRWHADRLTKSAGLEGTFSMDELETFETDRLVRPVTVPVLIQRRTLFVVYAETAPLPPRGRLDVFRRLRKERDEREFGPRKCGSRAAVKRTFESLSNVLAPGHFLEIVTDQKGSYRTLIKEIFAAHPRNHIQESSKKRRNRANALFPINHTLAMMRDGVSRLVRRSWGASKLRSRLTDHLWIWIVYRNFVRGITVKMKMTPAMAAGVCTRPMDASSIFRWRVFSPFSSLPSVQRIGPVSRLGN